MQETDLTIFHGVFASTFQGSSRPFSESSGYRRKRRERRPQTSPTPGLTEVKKPRLDWATLHAHLGHRCVDLSLRRKTEGVGPGDEPANGRGNAAEHGSIATTATVASAGQAGFTGSQVGTRSNHQHHRARFYRHQGRLCLGSQTQGVPRTGDVHRRDPRGTPV